MQPSDFSRREILRVLAAGATIAALAFDASRSSAQELLFPPPLPTNVVRDQQASYLFQLVNRKKPSGFVGGYPTMSSARNVGYDLNGAVLLRASGVEFRDVPLADLKSPPLEDFGARMRAAQVYATENGFVGGFPTFEHADYGRGIVCGTVLLKKEAAEHRDVPLNRLGGDIEDFVKRFGETHNYAKELGFVGGFPNMFYADYPDKGRVCGTILVKASVAEWQDIRTDTPILK